jgi:hypothetical protein
LTRYAIKKTLAIMLGCKIMDEYSEIFQIAEQLSDMATKCDARPLAELMRAAEDVGKSWSGSWFGYHSRVYYKDLKPVPPGARFSKEWGLMDPMISDTIGKWAEYEFEGVVRAIYEMAGNPDCSKVKDLSMQAKSLFEESQARLLSVLSIVFQEHEIDPFLKDSTDKIKEICIVEASDFVRLWVPSGKFVSSDLNAIQAGLMTPPHISVRAGMSAIMSPFDACNNLGKLARRVASHIENLEKRQHRELRVGTNVFIGHGRSRVWKDLKDFVQDRLHLPWDEFNRVPVAGLANTLRLSQMLDDAAIAFLILTGEDEQADSKIHARMNVVHEVGLFQGRLGFEKAIVLLEDGCEEFSNINGLGQIRFPKGNITAAFEEIRRVLERENLIED